MIYVLERLILLHQILGIVRENTANVKLNIFNKTVNLETSWAKVIFLSLPQLLWMEFDKKERFSGVIPSMR